MKYWLNLMIFGGWLSAAIYADDIADIAALSPQFAATEKDFLLAEAAKMQAAGLDPKPLYNKVREGLAKGASIGALRQAIAREREFYTEAARLIVAVSAGGHPTKNEIAHSIVIATKRGAKNSDIESAVQQNKQNPKTLISIVDVLGDFARSGVFGDKAVRAAMVNATRKSGVMAVVPENRADVNRSILQRETRQELNILKPMPEPTRPPTGSQGNIDTKH